MENHLDPFELIIERQAEAHVTSYLVIATVERLDNDTSIQSLYIQTPHTQTSTTSLGLAQAVAALEQARIIRTFGIHDYDDDE